MTLSMAAQPSLTTGDVGAMRAMGGELLKARNILFVAFYDMSGKNIALASRERSMRSAPTVAAEHGSQFAVAGADGNVGRAGGISRGVPAGVGNRVARTGIAADGVRVGGDFTHAGKVAGRAGQLPGDGNRMRGDSGDSAAGVFAGARDFPADPQAGAGDQPDRGRRSGRGGGNGPERRHRRSGPLVQCDDRDGQGAAAGPAAGESPAGRSQQRVGTEGGAADVTA